MNNECMNVRELTYTSYRDILIGQREVNYNQIIKYILLINFMVGFYNPWKHQKTSVCCDVFRGYRKKAVAWNGLLKHKQYYKSYTCFHKNNGIFLCFFHVILKILEIAWVIKESKVL